MLVEELGDAQVVGAGIDWRCTSDCDDSVKRRDCVHICAVWLLALAIAAEAAMYRCMGTACFGDH